MRRLSPAWLLALAACPASSVSNDAGLVAPSFDRKALLSSFSTVIVAGYRDFSTKADALSAAVEAYAGTATSSTADPRAARAAFLAAMESWQEAELYSVGPAGSKTLRAGGQDLRARIYSWPTVNACRVDQETARKGYEAADYSSARLVNVLGLDSLEYLLFHSAPTNDCAAQIDINADGTWAALSDAEKRKRRAEHAKVIARQVASDARTLLAAWTDGFAARFANAGDGTPYPSAQAALDEVFAALFYLEFMVKDQKLAVPAGVSKECPGTTCPDRRESRWADRDKEYLAANLRGFRRLFTGGEGAGFDDFLEAAGVGDLSTRILAELSAADGALAALPGSFSASLADPMPARNLHGAVKKVTDLLKTQFVSVLHLRVPAEGAGDND